MNMNKKTFLIIGGVSLVLILIVSVLLIFLTGRNEKKKINYSMEDIAQNNIEEEKPKESEKPKENENNEQSKIEGEITYITISDGNEIPLPPTFEYIEGEIETGAIIQDEDGNQFVWIPIENKESYQRQIFENNGDGVTVEEIEDLNLNEEKAYNKDFDDSIEKYNGFYVARYEAGKENGNEKPVSKPDVLPWTQVVWDKARDLSIKMYRENEYFQTDLINSYAWDSICNWIRFTGTNIDDSTSYGNYQNSSDGLNRVVETGSNNRWKINNIYDMAGNVWEYTTEEYGDHEKYHIGRGGGYWNYGDLYPISTRGTSEDGSDLNIGFRVVMYLK